MRRGAAAVFVLGLAVLVGCSLSARGMLKAKGYDFTPEEFCRAVKEENAGAVKLFLRAGMEPVAAGAVFTAAASGKLAMLELLADGGAALDKPCREGAPILLAAKAGRSEVVEYLATRGVPISFGDEKGVTVLMYAAGACDLTSVRALLGRKAEAAAKDSRGWTAWTYAHERDEKDMADLLAEAGAETYVDPDRDLFLRYARDLDPTFAGSLAGESERLPKGYLADVADFRRLALKICCQMGGSKAAVEEYLSRRGFAMTALRLKTKLWGTEGDACGGCP